MRRNIRMLLSVLVTTAAVLAVLASGSTNKAEKVSGGGSKGSTRSSFKVGDEVKLGDWTVKAHAFNDPQTSPNQFSKPAAGNRWVSADVEVKNHSKKPQTVSSLACFKIQDDANRGYDETIAAGVTPGPPDGEVAPGAALRGLITFEVPADAKGFGLHFKCDLFSSGTAVIKLS
ncbi:MAG: DUF4352 domain-containing protein [Acidimicrobiia bacterium]